MPFDLLTSAMFLRLVFCLIATTSTTATAKSLQRTTAHPLQRTTAHPLQRTTTHPLQRTTASPLQRTTTHPLQRTTAHPLQRTTTHPLQRTTAHPLQRTTAYPSSQDKAKRAEEANLYPRLTPATVSKQEELKDPVTKGIEKATLYNSTITSGANSRIFHNFKKQDNRLRSGFRVSPCLSSRCKGPEFDSRGKRWGFSIWNAGCSQKVVIFSVAERTVFIRNENEAEKCPKFKNMLRTYRGWRKAKNFFLDTAQDRGILCLVLFLGACRVVRVCNILFHILSYRSR